MSMLSWSDRDWRQFQKGTIFGSFFGTVLGGWVSHLIVMVLQ